MTHRDLSTLSIEEKIGQLFFVGIPGPAIDQDTRSFLSDIRPGGICLFARNIKSLEQIRSLLDSLREFLPVAPFLSIDQEGGLVDRLRRVITPMPAASRIRTEDDARGFGRIVGEGLNLLGFNMNFAPVVDVIDEGRSKFTNGLHSRAFGNNEDEATRMAAAFLDGLNSEGIIGCLKHFPGLGASEVDSHEDLPKISVPRSEFFERDLYPYREIFLSGKTYCVMVGHALFPNTGLQEAGLDGKILPSSLDHSIVTGLLRNDLAFDGVSVTDDLEMGAIVNEYGMGEACRLAIEAGQDMVAICAGQKSVREGFDALLKAVSDGSLTEPRIDESLSRIAKLRSSITDPSPFDPGRLAQISLDIAEIDHRLNK